jgi:hypothetical protein
MYQVVGRIPGQLDCLVYGRKNSAKHLERGRVMYVATQAAGAMDVHAVALLLDRKIREL